MVAMTIVTTLKDLRWAMALPRLTINLRIADAAGNDPFYERVVREFYANTQRRHRKWPLVRNLQFGVAVCPLPADYSTYLGVVESSGVRNMKKAARLGYEFRQFAYNDHLEDIRGIRQSAEVRQGRMPEAFLKEELKPCQDPPSRSSLHDYVYFGVFKDGHLAAYAGCLVAGELCMVEQLLGHADHLENGIVPALLLGTARSLYESYTSVRFFAYGTYFGGGETLRRFKKKFGFHPHRVEWRLQ